MKPSCVLKTFMYMLSRTTIARKAGTGHARVDALLGSVNHDHIDKRYAVEII